MFHNKITTSALGVKSCKICHLDPPSTQLKCKHPSFPKEITFAPIYASSFKKVEKPKYEEEVREETKNTFFPNNKNTHGVVLPKNKCVKCPYGRYLYKTESGKENLYGIGELTDKCTMCDVEE